MLTAQQKKQFRRTVLSWYAKNRYDLPWRKTRDPYKILVSEVMLQQTQVDRVKEKWPEFLLQFPTLEFLARAPASAVIRAWKGMGYNRRALNLQRAAQAVVSVHKGKFPKTLEVLKTLPGVGEYTARAILVFAFGKSYIAPDVNVLRILRRSFSVVIPDRDRGSRNDRACLPARQGFRLRGRNDNNEAIMKQSNNEIIHDIIALGDAMVMPKTAYDLNQALMDLGRTICTAKNPKSALCPLHDQCDRYDRLVSKRLTKRAEPMFAGVPRRIWRGRIIELVRIYKTLRQDQLFSKLGIQKDSQSVQWIRSVLAKLSQDGLLALEGVMVAFP